MALQAELNRLGHVAKIITPKPVSHDGVDSKPIVMLGRSASFRSFKTKGDVTIVTSPQSIDELLTKEKFDVLHFHEPWVPFIGRQILGRSKAANVTTFHAALPSDVFSRAIIKGLTPYAKSTLKFIDTATAV